MSAPPTPPRVDHYDYWTEMPPAPSPRFLFWLDRIAAGWRPTGRTGRSGYDEFAARLGVYLWESQNIIAPACRGGGPIGCTQDEADAYVARARTTS